MNTAPHNGDIFTLCNVIRQTSFDIHHFLRSGHREYIYENALIHRLAKKGIRAEQQPRIPVLTRMVPSSDVLRQICSWRSS